MKEEKAMQRFLGLMAILALLAFSLPVSAQEAGRAGQDTAMAGRAGEGVTPEGATPQPGRTPEAGGLTEAEGIEGQPGARAGQDTLPAGRQDT
jgi:hypothetical protein